MTYDNTILRARVHFNYQWPEQLDSGVMFFEGTRITRDEFYDNKPAPVKPRVFKAENLGYDGWFISPLEKDAYRFEFVELSAYAALQGEVELLRENNKELKINVDIWREEVERLKEKLNQLAYQSDVWRDRYEKEMISTHDLGERLAEALQANEKAKNK